MTEKVAVYRREYFNAAHRLNNPALSEEENKRLFGKCNRPNYHGHNYELVVRVAGVVDTVTGYVIDTKILSDLIHEKILNRFDHSNLNLDVPEFKDLNPTVENIAIVIYRILRPLINQSLDLKITLHETDKNFAEFPA